MTDGDDRALEAVERAFQRLRRLDVEVVGWLVEQQHVVAFQLQDQDLQPGLLAARQRVELLPGIGSEAVASQ